MRVTEEEAQGILARHLLKLATITALSHELVGWEDYPQVTRGHWEEVSTRAHQLADVLATDTPEEVAAALKALSENPLKEPT
jgi:hypothetical protein